MSASMLAIRGSMSGKRACELQDSVLGALLYADVLELDLAGVTELDATGVQVLMLARHAARTMQCELRLCDPSPAVRAAIDLSLF